VHKVLASIIFVTVLISKVFAQDLSITVISSGGYYGENLGGYSLSYTFGECAVKTFTLSTMAFTEGFQQGKINNDPDKNIVYLTIYPNPVTQNKLYIDLPVRENMNSYIISIYSLTGQLIIAKQFLNLTYGVIAEFDFSPMAKGLCLVKIQSPDGTFLKTYKIEKQ